MKSLVLLVFCTVFLFYYVDGQNRKQSVPLGERVQQLTDMAQKKAVLRFNGYKFRDYVKSVPRNYSVIVMFTAMAPQRQCMVCRHANDEFNIVATSFKYSQQSYSNKLFFAIVDFDEGSDVFQMLRLNTAPVFMHFPPKGKPKPQDTMDIQRVGYHAEVLAKWIADRTDIQIRVFRPPNYSTNLMYVLIVLLVCAYLYWKWDNLQYLRSNLLWSCFGVIVCFFMVSGQMWNHIRGPPFIHKHQNGQVTYIHSSSQGQFVIETYIIFILNAAVVAGMVLLTEAGKGSDSRKKKMFTVVGLILVSVFFSLLLSIFRSKTSGYPYSFLFK